MSLSKNSGNNIWNLTNITSIDSLDWKHYDDAAAVISFILFIVIVLMNGIVIYALIFKEHKRSRLLYFVLHLAIADLSVGIFNVLGDGIQSAMNGEWHGGDILCKLWRYSKIVTMIGSNNILIGMSIDRFLAIRYPLNTVRLGGWRYLNKTLVISAWVISFVVASYTLKYAKGINAVPTAETFIEQKGSCDIIMSAEWLWKPYVIIYMLGVYIIPTIIITICYIGICLVIWNNLKAGMKLTEMNKKTNNGNLQDGADLHSGLLPKAKIRSVKMTVVICIAFFICWTPYFIILLLDVFDCNCVDPRYTMILGMLYPLNSACNPIIFMLFNRKLFDRQNQNKYTATSYGYVTALHRANDINHKLSL